MDQVSNETMTVTEAAAAKAGELLGANNKPDGAIRVFVKSGAAAATATAWRLTNAPWKATGLSRTAACG